MTAVLCKPGGEEKRDLPTVFYTHGAKARGRVERMLILRDSPNTYDRLLRDLVRETGYAFIFLYHTLAPDPRYSTQVEESYAVFDWIATNGASKGLKTDKFAVAGVSIGVKALLNQIINVSRHSIGP